MARGNSILSDSVELWIISSHAATISGLEKTNAASLGGMPNFVSMATWPGCEKCGRSMSFVAQLALRWLPLRKARQWGGTTVFVFYCFDCACGTAFGQSTQDFAYGPAQHESIEALKFRKLPPPLPHFDAALLYSDMRSTVDRNAMRGCVGYLGSDPKWNYDDASPYCSGCGKRTSFLLRLTSLRLKNGRWVWKFGNGGGIWITCCENCNGGEGRAAIDPRFYVVTQPATEDELNTARNMSISHMTEKIVDNSAKPAEKTESFVGKVLTPESEPNEDPAEARTSISLKPIAGTKPPTMKQMEDAPVLEPVPDEGAQGSKTGSDGKQTRFKLKKPGEYLSAPRRPSNRG